MTDGADIDRLLALVQRRRAYLRELATEPRHKRDLIDALGDSRSTVDRAVERLHDAGLVTRTDDGAWTATTKGTVLLETVEETYETVDAVTDAADLLPYLPCEEPVPPALFRDAAVEVATGPTPLAVAEDVRETMAGANAVRGFAVADHEVGVKADFFDAVLGEDPFAFEYVFDADLTAGLYPDGDVPWTALRDAPDTDIVVHDDLPFGLMLLDHGAETWLVLIVYDDQRVVRGQIRTPNPTAVAWGRGVFERYREAGTPLAEWVEDR